MTCLDRNSHCVNVWIFTIRICNFSNFVALCTDDTGTPVSCDKCFRDFWRICSYLSPISSNVRTWCWRSTFLFFTDPVSLNLLACLLIVLGLGTGRLGKFTRNLRRVSEHDFLLFIYVLWIHTRSHNENSCLGMLQIAIITITTLAVLTSNNNHNQYTLTSPLYKLRRCAWPCTRKLNWNSIVNVWEQRQYDAQLAGRRVIQGRERQPSVAARIIWEAL